MICYILYCLSSSYGFRGPVPHLKTMCSGVFMVILNSCIFIMFIIYIIQTGSLKHFKNLFIFVYIRFGGWSTQYNVLYSMICYILYCLSSSYGFRGPVPHLKTMYSGVFMVILNSCIFIMFITLFKPISFSFLFTSTELVQIVRLIITRLIVQVVRLIITRPIVQVVCLIITHHKTYCPVSALSSED